MSRSALDALLGIISDDGEELELLGGLNFIGFTITEDAANNRYDIEFNVTVDGGDLSAGSVALSKLVNAGAQNRILCRASSGAGAWEDSASIPAFTITTLTTSAINAASPLAPTEGAPLANADADTAVADGVQRAIPTLTANRTYDINNTGAVDEETITLYRTGTEAFTATIRDHADATIATFPASTKLAGVFRKATGANFVFVGWQRLA